MFSRGRKRITFWSLSNLFFNWIPFYQFGSSWKISQYISTRKSKANRMVLLVTPKFEFLTEKQRLKVKNDHFLIVFTGGRARTILTDYNVFDRSTDNLSPTLKIWKERRVSVGEDGWRTDLAPRDSVSLKRPKKLDELIEAHRARCAQRWRVRENWIFAWMTPLTAREQKTRSE